MHPAAANVLASNHALPPIVVAAVITVCPARFGDVLMVLSRLLPHVDVAGSLLPLCSHIGAHVRLASRGPAMDGGMQLLAALVDYDSGVELAVKCMASMARAMPWNPREEQVRRVDSHCG